MRLVGRTGADGTLALRKPFSLVPIYTAEWEKGYAVCHVRTGSGEYLASLERDGAIRGSLVFNVYKGSVRVGTVAAAERDTKERGALPAMSFSWGKRAFDGRTLSAPRWESDNGRRRDLAEIRIRPGRWVIRTASGTAPGDELDAVLAAAAAEVWLRAKSRGFQGGGMR